MFRFSDIHERERLEVERLSEDSRANEEKRLNLSEIDKILELANSEVFKQTHNDGKQGWQALFFFFLKVL